MSLYGGSSLKMRPVVKGWVSPDFQHLPTPCLPKLALFLFYKPPLTLSTSRPVGGQAAAGQAGPGACDQAAGPPALSYSGPLGATERKFLLQGGEVTSWPVTSYLPQARGQPAGCLGTVIWDCLLCPRNRLPQPALGPGFWWR